ncbi:hypothetical protein GF318_04340 [Candidatus Micrarchaeota archaeon]|nr:hypothetical protein [Candidatus Micrarchaeota archaeon]
MDIKAELLKSMEREELEQEVKLKIASFDGLLTREVALRLIAKEKGLLKSEQFMIGEVPKDARDFTIRGKITRVWPVMGYSSGKQSQVVEVKDETGEKPLVFWNRDTRLVQRLRARDLITVKGAYEKSGELHFGFQGSLSVEGRAGVSELKDIPDNETVHIKGRVSRLEGYDKFVRNGRGSVAFSFLISDGTAERRAIIWNDSERGERLKEGDEILVEGAGVNKGDIDIGLCSRLKIRRGNPEKKNAPSG